MRVPRFVRETLPLPTIRLRIHREHRIALTVERCGTPHANRKAARRRGSTRPTPALFPIRTVLVLVAAALLSLSAAGVLYLATGQPAHATALSCSVFAAATIWLNRLIEP